MKPIQIILEEAADDLYLKLQDDLKAYGIRELDKILIRDVPNDLLGHYLTILTYLELMETLPPEEQKGERVWPVQIQKNYSTKSKHQSKKSLKQRIVEWSSAMLSTMPLPFGRY
jgi:hypothetical protein